MIQGILRFSLCLLLSASTAACAQQLTFHRAIELAVKNSTSMAIAKVDENRSQQGYLEARNLFLPQMNVGSGLAYSNGFPLSVEGSAPSLLNVTSQQFLVNFAQREFIRAAKREWGATGLLAGEQKDQVILETAVAYTELDKLHGQLNILKQQTESAQNAESVASQRFQAGVDPEVEVTKAKLNFARVRFLIAQSETQADLLRLRLSQLTRLPLEQIATVTESIPQIPEPDPNTDVVARALESSNAIKIANEHAVAAQIRAKGEHKQLYPALDLAGQYGLLARYNNYDEFFRRFQRHNITVGVVVRFPFLNYAQKAHAVAADLDALKALQTAEATRQQVTSDMTKLQHSIRLLSAARDIAKLEYQIAGTDAQAAQTRVEAGSATLKDQENARLAESQKYAIFLDSSFELERAQLQLLKAAGQIEAWALGANSPDPQSH